MLTIIQILWTDSDIESEETDEVWDGSFEMPSSNFRVLDIVMSDTLEENNESMVHVADLSANTLNRTSSTVKQNRPNTNSHKKYYLWLERGRFYAKSRYTRHSFYKTKNNSIN